MNKLIREKASIDEAKKHNDDPESYENEIHQRIPVFERYSTIKFYETSFKSCTLVHNK